MAKEHIKVSAFVAYPSGDPDMSEVIREGVSRANRYQKSIRYESWEYNDVPGKELISPILEKIDESKFIVADVTYLNLNVVYEIGFTIGRKKRAFLIRYAAPDGDKELAKETGIFDTLGYQKYNDYSDLNDCLTSHIDTTPLLFDTRLNREAPVYLVEPPTRTEEVTTMVSRVKKAGYRYRSFNSAEDIRLSASDAIRQVASSAGVVLILQEGEIVGSNIHNVRTLFVAGLSHGMGKPTLILSPVEYKVPLDVRDAAKYFIGVDEIIDNISSFCPSINEYLQHTQAMQIDTGGLLQSLSFGDPTAENEMTTLGNYYLKTDEFQRASRGDVNLVVGRKGSGKTALFIQVRDKMRSDKRNVVVDLKPEGYQLLKIKEDILQYLNDGARQHLITAFWEYLLLLEVAYKLLEKDRNTYRYNHDIHDAYTALESAYKVENFSTEGDFSERLLTLSQKLTEHYKDNYGNLDKQKITTKQVTEILYIHDMSNLRNQISAYLKKKGSVWVLFDNLDKGWNTQGVDDIDIVVLRCLIDAGRKLEREMRKVNLVLRCIIFIRNDVYDHLMAKSSDYGKEMRAVLDWTDSDMLKEMLRLRLVSGVSENQRNLTFEQIWSSICASHYKGEETSTYLIERSLMRPRNVLKLFSHARGSANNFNHSKITEDDIAKGVASYSQDLLVELNRELTDIFPAANDLLYRFIDAPSVISLDRITEIILEASFTEDDVETVIEFLLYYGVLGLRVRDDALFIYNVNYDVKRLTVRSSRTKQDTQYVINPAFWSVLGITGTK